MIARRLPIFCLVALMATAAEAQPVSCRGAYDAYATEDFDALTGQAGELSKAMADAANVARAGFSADLPFDAVASSINRIYLKSELAQGAGVMRRALGAWPALTEHFLAARFDSRFAEPGMKAVFDASSVQGDDVVVKASFTAAESPTAPAIAAVKRPKGADAERIWTSLREFTRRFDSAPDRYAAFASFAQRLLILAPQTHGSEQATIPIIAGFYSAWTGRAMSMRSATPSAVARSRANDALGLVPAAIVMPPEGFRAELARFAPEPPLN